MSSLTKTYVTPEEYIAAERRAEYKSEYFDGEVFAMSGASRQHNLIVTNVVAELHRQLKQSACEVYPNDMRVQIPTTPNYFYPDAIVACEKPQFADNHFDTLLNPTVVVEVLSPSTELYDRGRKFEQYRKIASLQEYLLIAQDEYLVERYVRQPDNDWLLSEFNRVEDVVHLASVKCDLALGEIYRKVEFTG